MLRPVHVLQFRPHLIRDAKGGDRREGEKRQEEIQERERPLDLLRHLRCGLDRAEAGRVMLPELAVTTRHQLSLVGPAQAVFVIRAHDHDRDRWFLHFLSRQCGGTCENQDGKADLSKSHGDGSESSPTT